MKQKKLSSKHIRYLRGLGHHLSPLAMIGQHGLTKQVLAAVDEVLQTHELVKIKIQYDSPSDRQNIAEKVAAQTGAALVQTLGKTALLYRANKDKKADKRIVLP
ncbi:MAG: ribosome assembly RNA-binding protein YhbY [Desulfobulbaceae bacterium]|nr:ribosome assembly RNA-binding protein YhbY [Desulfobulbaceae bacterium]